MQHLRNIAFALQTGSRPDVPAYGCLVADVATVRLLPPTLAGNGIPLRLSPGVDARNARRIATRRGALPLYHAIP